MLLVQVTHALLSINQCIKLMASPNLLKTQISYSIMLLMKMKIHKICISIRSEICFQVSLPTVLLLVLHMAKQVRERPLLSIKLQNTQLTIFLKLLRIILKPGFSCHFLKFMVENVWIYLIVKRSSKF